MNVVVPMAGHGRRFAVEGFTLPKPLIDVDGTPMYARATDSLPLELATRLVFVCLDEHLQRWPLHADIDARYGRYDPVVVGLDAVTSGQLATVMAAADHFVPGGIVIYNADTISRPHLAEALAGDPDLDGVIGVFEAPGDHWSFARLGPDGLVCETAEKRRISRWATTGLYHFSDVERFVDLATRHLAADAVSGGEHYVAPLYNDLIAQGGRVAVDVADLVVPLGTPGELREHQANGASMLGVDGQVR